MPPVPGSLFSASARVCRAAGEREYRSVLLRRSYREGGRVKTETLANLSHLPDELIELIELIRGWLRGECYIEAD